MSAKVVKAGREIRTIETVIIGTKTTTARGSRYLTLEDYRRQVLNSMLRVIEEETDANGNVKQAKVESVRYVESDASLVNRVLGKDGKKNTRPTRMSGTAKRVPLPRSISGRAVHFSK